jgi:hypothetical protein
MICSRLLGKTPFPTFGYYFALWIQRDTRYAQPQLRIGTLHCGCSTRSFSIEYATLGLALSRGPKGSGLIKSNREV